MQFTVSDWGVLWDHIYDHDSIPDHIRAKGIKEGILADKGRRLFTDYGKKLFQELRQHIKEFRKGVPLEKRKKFYHTEVSEENWLHLPVSSEDYVYIHPERHLFSTIKPETSPTKLLRDRDKRSKMEQILFCYSFVRMFPYAFQTVRINGLKLIIFHNDKKDRAFCAVQAKYFDFFEKQFQSELQYFVPKDFRYNVVLIKAPKSRVHKINKFVGGIALVRLPITWQFPEVPFA